MNTRISSLILVPILLLTLTACDKQNDTATDSPKASDVVNVNEPYIRAMPPGQAVTAMFLNLENTSDDSHALVQAESEVSEDVELHQHKMQDGMMKMGQVEQIELAPNTSTALAPGGYHIMLINLKKDLDVGENVDVNLVFKDGSSLLIQVPVKMIQTN